MNIKASYKYQLLGHKYPIITFYVVLLCIYAILFISTASQLGFHEVTVDASGRITGDSSVTSASFGGMSSSTIIFIFIVALNSFKESFRMQIQNGLSRRTILIGRLAAACMISFILSISDQFMLLIFKALASITNDNLSCISVFEQTYEHRASELSTFRLNAETILFDFFLYLGFMALGYFISLLFYRLNNIGKTLVGAGVPILLLVIFPVLDFFVTEKKIYGSIGNAFDYSFGLSSGKPIYAIITCLLLYVIVSGFSWLLIRKAPVKE